MAQIQQLGGRPAIVVDGKAYPPMMATIRTIDNDRLVLDREYFRQLGQSGIRIFFLICDTVWLKPEAFRLFDEEARMLLEEVPDALIIPRIGLHPTNDWIREHPEETVTYGDGTNPPVHLFTESYVTDLPAHYSLCSSVWRRDAGQALKETWNMLMDLPYADRIIGCFLAAGGTSEWYYMHPVVRDGTTMGHSEAFRRNFSWYLKEQYGDDAALRASWKREDVSLDQPRIPDADAHYFAARADEAAAVPPTRMYTNSPVPEPFGNGTNIGSFLNVEDHMDVYDFYRALHNGTAQSVLHFARIIKEMTPDRLVGAFYGSYGCTNFLGGGTAGGVVRILEDPNIDFLAAPGVYENREAGGFVGQREMNDSFTLHNKIYIVEEDARTHMENRFFADKYRIYDMTDSLNVMKRDFGRTICEDVQAWWFDQLLGGRRYKCPEIYDLIRRQQEIAQEAYRRDRRKNSEIAFIYDEESAQTVSQQTTAELVELPRNYEKDRIGAPVDLYFHNDMADPRMPAYKLYVFCNTLVLTEQERQQIRQKLQKDGAVALFLYAPGVVDPDKASFSTENMEALTGIRMGRVDERMDSKFRINGEEHPLTKGLDRRKFFGIFDRIRRNSLGQSISQYWESYLYPLFYADDPDAKVLASFLTSGYPALSVKEQEGFTSLFCGAKYLSSELLRAAAEYAGCHLYCRSDDVIYANRNYLVFHATSGGTKTLFLPEEMSPYEVYEGRYYGQKVREITFDCYLGETKMFDLRREDGWNL